MCPQLAVFVFCFIYLFILFWGSICARLVTARILVHFRNFRKGFFSVPSARGDQHERTSSSSSHKLMNEASRAPASLPLHKQTAAHLEGLRNRSKWAVKVRDARRRVPRLTSRFLFAFYWCGAPIRLPDNRGACCTCAPPLSSSRLQCCCSLLPCYETSRLSLLVCVFSSHRALGTSRGRGRREPSGAQLTYPRGSVASLKPAVQSSFLAALPNRLRGQSQKEVAYIKSYVNSGFNQAQSGALGSRNNH